MRSDTSRFPLVLAALIGGLALFEAGFLSLAHSEQDIERTIQAAEAAFAGVGR